MSLKSILNEITRKHNTFTNAHVILTRSKYAIKIMKKEIEMMDDQEKIDRYRHSISELKKIPLILDEYSDSLGLLAEKGDESLFFELKNTAYNAINSVI